MPAMLFPSKKTPTPRKNAGIPSVRYMVFMASPIPLYRGKGLFAASSLTIHYCVIRQFHHLKRVKPWNLVLIVSSGYSATIPQFPTKAAIEPFQPSFFAEAILLKILIVADLINGIYKNKYFTP